MYTIPYTFPQISRAILININEKLSFMLNEQFLSRLDIFKQKIVMTK